MRSITHVDTLLKTQFLELTVPELPEQGNSSTLGWEQISFALWGQRDLDGALANTVVDPLRREVQLLSEL